MASKHILACPSASCQIAANCLSNRAVFVLATSGMVGNLYEREEVLQLALTCCLFAGRARGGCTT